MSHKWKEPLIWKSKPPLHLSFPLPPLSVLFKIVQIATQFEENCFQLPKQEKTLSDRKTHSGSYEYMPVRSPALGRVTDWWSHWLPLWIHQIHTQARLSCQGAQCGHWGSPIPARFWMPTDDLGSGTCHQPGHWRFNSPLNLPRALQPETLPTQPSVPPPSVGVKPASKDSSYPLLPQSPRNALCIKPHPRPKFMHVRTHWKKN